LGAQGGHGMTGGSRHVVGRGGTMRRYRSTKDRGGAIGCGSDIVDRGGTIGHHRDATDRGGNIRCGYDVTGGNSAIRVTAHVGGDGTGGNIVGHVCDRADRGGRSQGVFGGHDDGTGLHVRANHPATTGGAFTMYLDIVYI
jgi:hypothetical protein